MKNKFTKKEKELIQKEVIPELNKYIKYMNPGFSNLPSTFQDIVINAFISGYSAKAKIELYNKED